MPDVTVSQYADVIGIPVDRLIEQLNEAGISEKSASDVITDVEKSELLGFLRRKHGKDASSEPRKITLKRKSVSEIKVPVSSPGSRAKQRSKTVSVEYRKKRTYAKRGVIEEEEARQRSLQAEKQAALEAEAEKQREAEAQAAQEEIAQEAATAEAASEVTAQPKQPETEEIQQVETAAPEEIAEEIPEEPVSEEVVAEEEPKAVEAEAEDKTSDKNLYRREYTSPQRNPDAAERNPPGHLRLSNDHHNMPLKCPRHPSSGRLRFLKVLP